MKKLMIAAAIVCAAALAQASCALSWKAGSGVYFVDGTGKEVGDVANLVLVNLGDTINWDGATEANVITSVGSSTPSVGQTSMKFNSSGTLNGQVKWNWADGGDNLIDNNDYLAIMYQDADGLHKLNYYNDGDPIAVGDEAVFKVTGITNNSYSGTNKIIGLTGDFTTASAVPEPTSAMLLLLGVAGLALRRKQK